MGVVASQLGAPSPSPGRAAVSDDRRTHKVIVIGAGMAGMAAAWSLLRAGVDVTVLERDDRVGGRVRTAVLDGLSIELGAGFLTNFYPRTLHLVEELGLTDRLMPVSRYGAIARGRRPRQVWPAQRFLTGRLVPHRSKLVLLKMAWPVVRHWRVLDHLAMWRADGLDTRSVTDYATAELDDEVLEYLLQPCLSGFLYWTPEQTSQALLFLLLKQALAFRDMVVPAGGMAVLPQRLAEGAEVRLGAEARQVRSNGHGRYEVLVRDRGGEGWLAADGVVCATTATAVAGMCPDLSPAQRAFFQAVRYSASICVALPTGAAASTLVRSILVPRREARRLAAVTVRSARGPEPRSSRAVATLYASDVGARALLGADDQKVGAGLLADLRAAVPAFGDGWEPSGGIVQRWPEALPTFDVGYLRRLRRFADGGLDSGGIVFAGDYLGGPFVEGAVGSGLAAAARLLAHLGYAELQGLRGASTQHGGR